MMKLITIFMVLAMFATPAFTQEQQAEQAEEQAEEAGQQAEEAEEQAEEAGEEAAQDTEQAEADTLGAEEEIDGQIAEGVFRLGDLQGTSLMNSDGEEVGEFQDAVLTDDGNVSHIIAELSEVQDLESGRYAIPASALSLENQNMVLDLQSASEFAQVEEGQKPQDAGQFDVLLSQLRDYEVIDNQGESVGDFEDVVVDLQSGQINYVALSFGGILGVGDEMFAVPYNDIWYNLSDQTVRVNVSEERLEQLNGFDQDNWPTDADEQWAQSEQASQDTLGAEAEQTVEETGEAVEETGEDVEQAAEETGEDIEAEQDTLGAEAEEAAEETGDAAEETAEETGEAVEETGEDVEQAAEETGEDIEQAAE